MAHKKIYMSVTATAVIAASAFFAAESVEAASYKVKSGDSLWAIAQMHETTVPNLMTINNLTGDLIFPNQIIETEAVQQDTIPEQPPAASESNQSTTYTVKRGDTLSAIAFQHNISLGNLMKWNNLDTTLIFPGNVFFVEEQIHTDDSAERPDSSESTTPEVPGASEDQTEEAPDSSEGSTPEVPKASEDQTEEAPDSSEGSNTIQPPVQEVLPAKIYTVKSGDTLSAIARQYKVTVPRLKTWNNLTSDLILIGQKLTVHADAQTDISAPEKPTVDVDYNIDTLIDAAHDLIGTSYAWGGQTPTGFDCSGFIHYIFNLAGLDIARHSTAGYYSRAYYVDNPQVGDLVFFENTYKQGISHMGIYIGNDEFIHAGSSNGVVIANINSTYWQQHFDGYKRFY